jgi:hypothetical protein
LSCAQAAARPNCRRSALPGRGSQAAARSARTFLVRPVPGAGRWGERGADRRQREIFRKQLRNRGRTMLKLPNSYSL